LAATLILRVNCDETAGEVETDQDKPAYDFFSMNC